MRKRLASFVMAFAAALLVACGALTLQSFRQLVASIRRADSEHLALLHIERAISALKDVRGGTRAVMLTGDARNGPDIRPALRTLDSELALVKELLRGDPRRQSEFADLGQRIDGFVQRSQGIVDAGRIPADRLPATVAEEKRLMAEIARGISSIEEGQMAGLRAEQSKVERNAVISLVGGGVGAAATMLMMIAMTLMLRRQIVERTEARNAMATTNDALTARMHELQIRTREMQLLSDMTEILQVSSTVEETGSVLPLFMARLFPGFDGAVYMLKPSRNLLDAVVTWGIDPIVTNLAPSECWALRKGRSHFAGDGPTLICNHVQPASDRPTLCIPMVAQGDSIGVLYLRAAAGTVVDSDLQFFAKTVGDQISLSLANLRLQETLRTRAVRDPLTGLFNRRYMEESLEREIRRARRNGTQIGVMMLDVDHFKRFNDTFGHQGGDALLQQLAHLMQNSVRDEDIVCRYGGEEFALILPETDEMVLSARAEDLRRDAKNLHVRLNGQSLGTITISIGLALAPAQGGSVDSIIAAADSALYEAKRGGRDRIISASGRSELRVVAAS